MLYNILLRVSAKDDEGVLLHNDVPTDILDAGAAGTAALDATQSCAVGSGSFKHSSCTRRVHLAIDDCSRRVLHA